MLRWRRFRPCEIYGLLLMDFTDFFFFFFALSHFYFLLQPMIQLSKVPSFSFCLPVYQIWMFTPVCACVVLIEPVQNKPNAGIRPGDTSGTHLCQMCVNCCFPIFLLSGCVTPSLYFSCVVFFNRILQNSCFGTNKCLPLWSWKREGQKSEYFVQETRGIKT